MTTGRGLHTHHRSYRSHPLQKDSGDCLGKPSVISTSMRKQSIHVFEGFDLIGVPHLQHNLEKCKKLGKVIYSVYTLDLIKTN